MCIARNEIHIAKQRKKILFSITRMNEILALENNETQRYQKEGATVIILPERETKMRGRINGAYARLVQIVLINVNSLTR